MTAHGFKKTFPGRNGEWVEDTFQPQRGQRKYYYLAGDDSSLSIDEVEPNDSYYLYDNSRLHGGIVSKHKTLEEAKVAYLFVKRHYT